jgi:hypothetical protein
MTSRLRTRKSMSNTGYHQNGKPTWWARIGEGETAKFIQIPWTRGDKRLDCVVDLPVGTTVVCGAGKGTYKTVRETVVTVPVDAPQEEYWF